MQHEGSKNKNPTTRAGYREIKGGPDGSSEGFTQLSRFLPILTHYIDY